MSTTQSTNEYPPTEEQQAALDIFRTGQDFVIEAGAGTGKTSTLVFIAEDAHARGLRGQFLAFNKAIVEDSAKRFPQSCDARTIHSLAHRAVRSQRPKLLARLGGKFCGRAAEASILDVRDIAVTVQIGDVKQSKRLAAQFLVAHALRGIERFCQSDDQEISAHHFPTIEGIDDPTNNANGSHRGENNRYLAKQMVPVMQRAWADLTNDEGRLRFTHSVYLKMWELSGPVIGTDYILFDEAQDVSGVMRSIVLQQQGRSQLVFVGDSQQEIYGWTGATNAMSHLSGPRTYLTQSFRFGPAVAEVANRVLDRIPGAELRLIGLDLIPSTLGALADPDAVLCRTNAKAVGTAVAAMADGKSVAIADSLKRNVIGFAKAADELRAHGSTTHPDLAPFDSWGAVQEFVENDPSGSDFKMLVDLIDSYGSGFIIAQLANTVTEEKADLVVSTAHTSKGREWNTVQLADDFTRAGDGLSPEELRLLYVAVTRAKLILDAIRVPAVLGGGEDEDGDGDDEGGEPVIPDPSPAPAPAPVAAEPEELAEVIDLPVQTTIAWGDARAGAIVEDPEWGRFRIDSVRRREGLVRILGKRIGQTGQVLLDAPADKRVILFSLPA